MRLCIERLIPVRKGRPVVFDLPAIETPADFANALGALARLLATIPLELQREGLSLASLQASLRGRWRGNCHPGELGAALRKLGLKRERRWHDGSGIRALWYRSLTVSPYPPPRRTAQRGAKITVG